MSKESYEMRSMIQAGIEEYENRERSKEALSSIRDVMREYEAPQDLYADRVFEQMERVDQLFGEIGEDVRMALECREFDGVIEVCREALAACGVQGAEYASTHSPSFAIAIAEAVNWAAKTLTESFYKIKPPAIVAAAQLEGVYFGWGEDDAYYLGNESVGVASFHDPFGEIAALYEQLQGAIIPQWKDEWSGVERQDEAFEILNDLSSGGGEGVVESYAETTATEEMLAARKAYMQKNYSNRLTVLGDVLKKAYTDDR